MIRSPATVLVAISVVELLELGVGERGVRVVVAASNWVVSVHRWAHRLIVIVKSVRVESCLPSGGSFAGDLADEALFDHRPLCEVGHRGALLGVARALEVCPVVAGLLELVYPFLQGLFLAYEELHLLQRVLAGEVFQDGKALPQVFVLVL